MSMDRHVHTSTWRHLRCGRRSVGGHDLNVRIGGSVVECSPATRAARVRFPADARSFARIVSFREQSKLVLPGLGS